MTALYLCGATNPEGVRLALRINRQEQRWERIVLLDDDSTLHGKVVLGVEIAGPFAFLETVDPEESEIANLVARTTETRQRVREKLASYGPPFASLVDPGVDTFGAELARDVTVYPNANVCAHAVIGDGSVVFMGATVGHASRMGAGCVLGPGAVTNARVELGDGVYVGANATVLPEVKIGPWAKVAAGSVVMMNVRAGTTVIGLPAKAMPLPRRRAQSS